MKCSAPLCATALSACFCSGCTAVCFGFAIMFIVPFVKSWPYQPVFTLDTLKRVLSDNSLVDVYVNSLMVAGITAVAGTVLCYAAAMVNARSTLTNTAKLLWTLLPW